MVSARCLAVNDEQRAPPEANVGFGRDERIADAGGMAEAQCAVGQRIFQAGERDPFGISGQRYERQAVAGGAVHHGLSADNPEGVGAAHQAQGQSRKRGVGQQHEVGQALVPAGAQRAEDDRRLGPLADGGEDRQLQVGLIFASGVHLEAGAGLL